MSRDDNADDGDTIAVEAVDTEDMVRSRRLRAIFDAKKECREVRRKVQTLVSDDKEATYTATSHYRHALETYVREVEPLFSQTEPGRRYWTQHDFGELHVSPAVEHTSVGDTRRSRQKLVRTGSYLVDDPPKKVIDLTGLNCLFELSSPITFETECMVKSSTFGEGNTLETVHVEGQIDFQTLDDMYAVVNGHLAELGLDIEIDDSDTTASADYSDIV